MLNLWVNQAFWKLALKIEKKIFFLIQKVFSNLANKNKLGILTLLVNF